MWRSCEVGVLDGEGLVQSVQDFLLSEFEEKCKVQLVIPKQHGLKKDMLFQPSTPELVSTVEDHMLQSTLYKC